MDYYAVIGKPIMHSKSPRMQNAAFSKSGIDALYVRICAANLEHALEAAGEIGVRAANVTSPFKEKAAAICDSLDRNAELLGAANCLVFSNGKIKGHNTDVAGVSKALSENNIAVKGKNVLVIGSGGAAKAAVLALKNGGAQITVANRTVQKAREIAEKFNCGFRSLEKSEIAKCIAKADMIISAVPDFPQIPVDMLSAGCIVMDANYSKKSPLVAAAEKKGCKIISGKEWLLYQGAESFEIFTNEKAPVKVMKSALENDSSDKSKAGSIALIGFMASGKSSVAAQIAKRSKFRLIDLDEAIEESQKMPVQDIFSKQGEPFFREFESRKLHEVISGLNYDSVISCGGGTTLDPKNVDALRSVAKIFCLWTDLGTILSRVGGKNKRPLLAGNDRQSTAEKILAERKFAYLSSADCIISTTSRAPDEIAEVILGEICS